MDEDQAQTLPITSSNDSSANVILNLEEMIKSHLSSLDRLTEELKKHQGMLDDIFLNDPTFKDHSEKAKEASKIKSATKQQILKQPQVADLATKVKNLRSEAKEIKDALSDYLQEYRRMSGATEIEHNGEVREIVYVAKLVNRSNRPEEYKRR